MCRTLTASKRAKTTPRHISDDELFLRVSKSAIPDGGWTDETFRGAARLQLIRDVVNVQRYAKAQGIRLISSGLSDILRSQVERVAETAEMLYARIYGGSKAVVEIGLESHSNLWEQAISQELQNAGIEVSTTMQAPVQSVALSTNEKVGLLLGGGHPSDAQLNALSRRTNEIAKTITGINQTTENRIRDTVMDALREGDTVFDVADKLRKRIPQIATNRVPTIARTEMGKAADNGTKLAMKNSEVVSHFSVIGCEAIEKNSPHWNGEPTCNIQNVPIQYEYEIEFHPNHTGAIVMSGFIRDDGSHPDLPLRGEDYGTTEFGEQLEGI